MGKISAVVAIAVMVASCAAFSSGATTRAQNFGRQQRVAESLGQPDSFTLTSPARSPTPTATPTGTPGTYVSAKWLYSLDYPTTWYDLSNFGAPDNQKYFSDQNVAAPLIMTDGGAWVTISVNIRPGSPCDAGPNMGPASAQVAISVDGVPTVEIVGGDDADLFITHKSWCYELSLITYSDHARDQHLPEFNAIIRSFRFNR